MRQIFAQPGLLPCCLGLALCLVARDTPQFLSLGIYSTSALSQYLIAGSRAAVLLACAVLAVKIPDGDFALARLRKGLTAGCVAASLLESSGIALQAFSGTPALEHLGSALLGLGHSGLIACWSIWLLSLHRRRVFAVLFASLGIAGVLQMILGLAVDPTTLVVTLVAPFASSAIFMAFSRSGEDDCETPGLPAKDAGGSFALTPRALLGLFVFFGYSFIARQLTDLWMADEVDSGLVAFQFMGGLGVTACAGIVFLLFMLRRSYKNSVTYNVVVMVVTVFALYLSTFLSGVFNSVYLVPLFIIRKMLLVLAALAAFEYSGLRSRFASFASSLLFVELGSLAQTAFYEATLAVQLPIDFVTPLVMTAILVYIVTVEWTAVYRHHDQADFADGTLDGPGAFEVSARRADPAAAMQAEFGLTDREAEVLRILLQGRNAEYVAKTLGVAHSTAKSHIAHIYQKTGFNSQQRLMDEAERRSESL